jgi:hypothetical protein
MGVAFHNNGVAFATQKIKKCVFLINRYIFMFNYSNNFLIKIIRNIIVKNIYDLID